MSILAQIDLTLALSPEAWAEQLPLKQAALSQLLRPTYAQKRPVVMVFEGFAGAGQGEAIKYLTEKLDPRFHIVYPNVPAEGEEVARPYLYRFWRRLPGRGHVAIFDGSWYARVLAGRGDGLCTAAEWKRAYREVDQFERQLTDFGTVIIKFWMHISMEEQQRRLSAAGEPAWAPDRRARYATAVEELLLKTSTLNAPWTIVEADDAAWAQIRVLSTVVEALFEARRPTHAPTLAAEDAMDAQDKPGGKKTQRVSAKPEPNIL